MNSIIKQKMYIQNKDKWLNYKHIGQIIINKCDGIIFGGYVRDSILHDHYASEFYKNHTGFCSEELNIKYVDIDYNIETINRLLLPTDIDVYLPNNNFKQLVIELLNNNYTIHKKIIRKGSQYFNNIDINIADKLTHIILYIKPSLSKVYEILSQIILNTDEIKSILKKMKKELFIIKLDVFISDIKLNDPFFGEIDFECNSLYLTKHGISISNKLTKSLTFLETNNKLQEIINNIIKKKAIWINPNIKRIYKMFIKEWNIDHNKVYLHSNEENYEKNICLICQEDIDFLSFKMKCCNGYMHVNCFIELLNSENSNKCIHCNKQY